MNILIVEDEHDLGKTISDYLKISGYVCEWVDNFEKGMEKTWVYTYDCILVDINLPGGSGLKIIDRLKKLKSKSGIIIISARNAIEDRIYGLDLGADDYITKPFDLSELNARIKSLLRRRNFEAQNEIIFNEIIAMPYEKVVTVNEKPLNLTRKEFDLLLFFLSNTNRVITKETIAEHLWGDDIDMAGSYDFIYSHLKNLRKKIQDKGGTNYIHSIYGVGYKFSKE